VKGESMEQINKLKQRGFEVVSAFEGSGINIPHRKTSRAAGYDIEAAENGMIPAGKKAIIPTGLKAYMGADEWLEIHVRSGHAAKYDLALQNADGVIDADYYNNPANEGHIMILLRNEGEQPFEFKKGDCIAQGIFSQYLTADDDNPGGFRNGGLGSTEK